MADEERKQNLPQVNYLATLGYDDYQYESVPLPKTGLEEASAAAQSGGMSAQFENVNSGLNNNA